MDYQLGGLNRDIYNITSYGINYVCLRITKNFDWKLLSEYIKEAFPQGVFDFEVNNFILTIEWREI